MRAALLFLLLTACSIPVKPELQPMCGVVAGTVTPERVHVARHCVGSHG